MKILGIDYGTKRIGIALTDDDGTMAFPHSVIENNNKIIENFGKLIKENNVEAIIIGESKNYKMEDNLIMDDILNLKKVLEKEFNLEVDLHPEVLTSHQAEFIQGKNEMIDASAASIILQSYLDSNKKS
jgi:putative Holliday junction resolvase